MVCFLWNPLGTKHVNKVLLNHVQIATASFKCCAGLPKCVASSDTLSFQDEALETICAHLRAKVLNTYLHVAAQKFLFANVFYRILYVYIYIYICVCVYAITWYVYSKPIHADGKL